MWHAWTGGRPPPGGAFLHAAPSGGAVDTHAARRRMVAALAERGLLHDARVEGALLATPRDAFLAAGQAYEDAPQPIGAGQTMSAPHMVALMTQALDVRPHHRVLEVGSGSGYHAAVLARLARHVVTVEVVAELAERARETLARLRVTNVEVVHGDGSEGHAPGAPYDRISVAAGAPSIPRPLVEQLAPEGVLVVPVGPRDEQTLLRVDAHGEARALMPVRFVPLVGAHGWPT